jgi:competence protein ComEA
MPLRIYHRGRCILAAVVVWLPGHALRADDAQAPLAREVQSLQAVCGKCHNLELVTSAQKSFDDWEDTMQMMIDRGARGTDQQYDDILDYLHRMQTTINVNDADAHELQVVLNVNAEVAAAIIARRGTSPFKGLDDLMSVPGVESESLNTRSRLIFF